MNITSGTFKTINYKFVKGSSRLIVIFPRAGAKFLTHRKLVNLLTNFGSVLFLETGYFGISKARKGFNEISIDSFRESLYGLLNKINHKKIVLIGESVGAIHALNYASTYKDAVDIIILSNPALFKSKLTFELLLIPLLKLGIITSPEIFLIILGKILGFAPLKFNRTLSETFIKMTQTIGALSYLYCLNEVVNFRKKYISKEVRDILTKTYVIKGKEDKFFDTACNEEYCRNSLQYIELPSLGHGIIDVNPSSVIKILRSIEN